MDNYCDVCGKTIENESKGKRFRRLTQRIWKGFRIKHIIENQDFIDIVSMFYKCITNHKNIDTS